MRTRPYTINEINTILNNCKDIKSLEKAKEIFLSEFQKEYTKQELNSVYRLFNRSVQFIAMLN